MDAELRANKTPSRPSKRMSIQVEPKFFNELSGLVVGKIQRNSSELPSKAPTKPPPVPPKTNSNLTSNNISNKTLSSEKTSLFKKPDSLPPPLPPKPNNAEVQLDNPPISPIRAFSEKNIRVHAEMQQPAIKLTVAFVEQQTVFEIEVISITTAKAARSIILSKHPNFPTIDNSVYDNHYFYRIVNGSCIVVPENELLVNSSQSSRTFAFSKKDIVDNLHKKPSSNRFASLRGNKNNSDSIDNAASQSFLLHFIKKANDQPSSISSSSSFSSPSVNVSPRKESPRNGVSPQPLSISNISRHSPSPVHKTPENEQEKVDNPISELVSTERSFIWDLDLMIQYFVKELSEKVILPNKTIQDMFLNIENVAKLHKEIFRRLQQDSSVAGIAEIFGRDMIQEIERVYTIYLGHYEQALALFYSLREKSGNFTKFLARVNEEPITKDKSLKNLLVVPMQRICKYELLLNSIAAKERKLNTNKMTPELEEAIKKLTINAQILNTTLLKIDQKRSEADKWASVIKLEEKLSTSEPLRKRGRYIAKEAELVVYNLLNQDEVLRCYVVLFNDIFLRAKISKNNNRVLEMTPLRQYILFDKQCQFCKENCINIASLDPRGHVLRIELSNKAEKEKWTQSFEKLTAKQERLSKQWDMASDIELGTLLAADKCQWDHAYVQHCRMFITSRHLLLAWEAFGSWERESIPLREIESAIMTGDDKLTLNLSKDNWKEKYHFTGVRRLAHTHEILETAMLEQAVMEAKGVSIKGFETNIKKEEIVVDHSYSPCCDLQFLKISDEEWSNIWNGDEVAYKAGDVILSHDSKSSNLYQVVTGSVTIKSKSDKLRGTLTAGEFFGLSNFLTATPSHLNFISGEEGVSVITISRPIVLQHLKEEPVLLGKFFALLACKMSDHAQLFLNPKKKEKRSNRKSKTIHVASADDA